MYGINKEKKKNGKVLEQFFSEKMIFSVAGQKANEVNVTVNVDML